MCRLSWFFGSWVLLLPQLPRSSRSLRLFPWASISWALGHLLESTARSSFTTRAKTGRTAHVFTAQGGTRRKDTSSLEIQKKTKIPKMHKIPHSGLGPENTKNTKKLQNGQKMAFFVILVFFLYFGGPTRDGGFCTFFFVFFFRGRPHLAGTFYPKISLFPQFYRKKRPRKTPTNVCGFFMFPSFFFFLISVFFAFVFLLSSRTS